jgi:hypothetical protein
VELEEITESLSPCFEIIVLCNVEKVALQAFGITAEEQSALSIDVAMVILLFFGMMVRTSVFL